MHAGKKNVDDEILSRQAQWHTCWPINRMQRNQRRNRLPSVHADYASLPGISETVLNQFASSDSGVEELQKKTLPPLQVNV